MISKISAETAAWDSTKQAWTLRKYYRRDFVNGKEVISFGTQMDTVINLSIEDFYRRENTVESLDYFQLNELIETQKMRGDTMVKYSLIEKNNRYAMPFSAFILTIIGVSLSSKKRRGGIGINLGVGIALSFSYILFMRFSQMFVFTGTLPPGIAIWLPNVLYAIIAAVLYRMAPK